MVLKIIPAIMSGGAGSRLWPMSTAEQPKQFHCLSGVHTMIQTTALRFRGAVAGLEFLDPIIVAGAPHRHVIEEQLSSVGVSPLAVILEPMGRNTAATALLAADAAAAIDPSALVLLLPADHIIADPQAFLAAIVASARTARERIVTFGIKPTGPETGYGYIARGEALDEGVYEINRFREKPDLENARRMWDDGSHCWNAGIFFFSPAIVQAEFSLAPDIRDCVRRAAAQATKDGVITLLPAEAFARTPSVAFDVAIMQPTKASAVTPVDMGWADVGSWSEVWRASPHDAAGNATSGPVAVMDSNNCLFFSEDLPLAASGLKDTIVVSTRSGVLVVPMDRAQDVKALVNTLFK
jgi:mannose-1-phosphate guanylyltransferase/mannose-6-phosphate isomerase